MATQILNNCHFDATRIQKLYLGAPTFPLEYQTVEISDDSIVAYTSWIGDTMVIGGQTVTLQEVLSIDGNITFTEELIIDARGKNYLKTITCSIPGVDLALINALELYTETENGKIIPTPMFAILLDENNEYLIVGYDNPLSLESNSTSIGADNLVNLTFTSRSKSRSRSVMEYNNCFNCGMGFATGDTIYDTYINIDQTAYICGITLTAYDTEDIYGIVKIHKNGVRDTSFTSPFTGSTTLVGANQMALQVNRLFPLSDGKLILVGGFNSCGNRVTSGIVRINSDGSRDDTFNAGGIGFWNATGVNPITINSAKVLSDNKILVALAQSSAYYNGVSMPTALLRLNSDGSYDNTFNAFSSIGLSGFTNGDNIDIQPDGKIIVGYSVAANNIRRLNADGTLDSTFTISSYSGLRIIKVLSDGKIMVGGQFAGAIAKLNSDGTVDTSFNTGARFSGTTITATIYEIIEESDGNYLIGGQFDLYSGVSVSRGIIRLDTNGNIVNSTDIWGTGFYQTLNTIRKLSFYANGDLLALGFFDAYKDTTFHTSKIARITPSGTLLNCVDSERFPYLNSFTSPITIDGTNTVGRLYVRTPKDGSIPTINVSVWGGGSAGANGSASTGGGGGGGGAYVSGTVSIAPGEMLMFNAGTLSTPIVSSGSASYLIDHVTGAYYLRAGGGASHTGAAAGAGGVVLNGSGYSGGNGAAGSATYGGGGGEGACTTQNGNNASGSTGGTGCDGGDGANGGASAGVPGSNGIAPGGGGGGGGVGAGVAGGQGAPGRVIISW